MLTIYLAGPIKGQSYSGATGWRDYARQRLLDNGIIGLSPMRGKEFLKGTEKLDDQQYQHPLTTDIGITGRDRWDVNHCDIVLMNLLDTTEISIGSMIEIGWADILRKPLVLVMTPENVHWHPMARACAISVVPTLDQALNLICALDG